MYILNKTVTNTQTSTTEEPIFWYNTMKAVSNPSLPSDNFCITFTQNAL